MSLCRNMVNDFMFGWGDTEPVLKLPLYDKTDLRFGADYARCYIAEGETHDLISGFELRPFAEWCEAKLRHFPPSRLTMNNYADTDKKIIAAVRAGKNQFYMLMDCGEYRVIDRRLQALRKRGELTYTRKDGWKVSEPREGE